MISNNFLTKTSAMKTNALLTLKKTMNYLKSTQHINSKLLIIIIFLLIGVPLQANTQYPKTNFLDIAALKPAEVLPPPPVDDSRKKEDLFLLKDAMAARTKKQVSRATSATSDNIFDYSQVLGPNFNAAQLPRLATIFQKVKNDTRVAIHIAKNTFQRMRPCTWAKMKSNDKTEGYAYPSGHSTRAFLWAGLLSDLFPKEHKAIMLQARQKAWNRVILGRHYPDDVYGGELYGKYLAKQFLKSPSFQKEWAGVKQETRNFSIEKNPFVKANNSLWSLRTLL